MNMRNTTLLLSLLAVAGASSLASADDAAAGRARGRAVAHTADGGRVAAGGAAARGTNGAYAHGHRVTSDGQGNVEGSRRAMAVGANGGTAQSQGSSYRNADGSAGRQGSASATGPDGGTASTSGSITRDADGNVNGSRGSSVTGKDGNSYNGSTTVQDGTVTHTANCTNAAGETIACPSRGN